MRRLLLVSVLLTLLVPAPAAALDGRGWIINGTKSASGSYPWQVALTYGGNPPGSASQFCGGTLVAPTIVVTAAHCTGGLRARDIAVFAGQASLNVASQSIGVSAISTPAQANGSADPPVNDVSVVVLSSAVTGTAAEEPMRVIGAEGGDEDALWAPGRPLVVTGWGENAAGTSPSDLFEVELDRIADASCDAAWGGDVDPLSMVCAGVAANAAGTLIGQGRDSCVGDSGGGLLARTTQFGYPFRAAPWRLVGIVSWGAYPCDKAGVPGVYTRVAAPVVRGHITSFLTGDPAPATPEADGPPELTGVAAVGEAVHCASPGWGGQDVDETYEIFRVGADASRRVATGADYTVGAADAGSSLACFVTATPAGGGGRAYAESLPLGPVRTTQPEGPEPSAGDTDADAAAPDPAPTPAPAPSQPAGAPDEPAPAPAPVPVPRDVSPPRAVAVGKRCTLRRRCRLTVAVSDAQPSAGIERVGARISFRGRVRCAKPSQRRRCFRRRTRTVSARRRSDLLFVVRTGRLPRGRAVIRLRAIDAAGNAQNVPTVLRLRVR